MSLPEFKPSTAQAIADALFHQYGVPMGFVVIVMPVGDVEAAEQLARGETPEQIPRVAVANANVPQHMATAMLVNAAEAAKAIDAQAATLEHTKGNA